MAEKDAGASERAAGAVSTTHLYYADTELFFNTGKVIGEHSAEVNGSQLLAVVLDQTVMHPQGGRYICFKGWSANV